MATHPENRTGTSPPGVVAIRIPPRSLDEAGFVQVAVLIGLAVVAALLTATMTLSTTASRSVAAYERLVVSELAALGAAHRLVVALSEPGDDFEQRALHGESALELGPLRVAVRLESEAGKINLLHAREELLDGLLQQMTRQPVEARQIRATLELARAEADAGAALDAVEAAWIVAGGEGDIRTHVTTSGISSLIDPTYASEIVLRSIPDISAGEIARYAGLPPEARRTERLNSAYLESGGRLYALHVSAGGAGQPGFSTRIYFEVTGAGTPIVLGGAVY